MKHIYTLFIALFVLAAATQAQVTIYHENLTAPTGLYSSAAGEWGISTVAPGSNTSKASGGRYAATSTDTNAGMRNKVLTFYNSINTIGYKGITLSWLDYRTFKNNGNSGAMNGNPVKLFYSTDKGATWTEFTGFDRTVTYTTWIRRTAQLPIVCNNVEDIRFRWEVANDNKHNDYYAIDDITITGLPESGISTFDWGTRPVNENPFVVSAPGAATPYSVDGIKLFFSRSSGTAVNITEAVVNTRFQSPKQSLSLVQSGSNSSIGSDIQISFSKAVSDLSFTLFDVDQASGQFQDRIVIVGYNSMNGVVALSEKKVEHTRSNTFNNTDGIVGVSGSDVVTSSNEGDVSVTFSGEVERIVISYYNNDAASGQQGIGIHNLTWRFDQPITPLPVELTSFKGQRSSHIVSLAWATASELDNKGFEVQASTDGRNFKTVAFVESKVGTTSIAQHYSFTHKNPAAGTNYYRLRQVDFDGTFEFSKTIAVQFTVAVASSVYPTLATEQVTVKLLSTEEQVTVTLSDMNGRQLLQVINPSEREVLLPVSHLQQGMYFVSIISGTQKETFRVLKR